MSIQKTAKRVKQQPQYVTAGKYFSVDANGQPNGQDLVLRERINAMRRSVDHSNMVKTAGMFGEELAPADIADSNNIGYNSFEFPIDALEMPASRPEELRFYRLAYDRDAIVNRAINLHAELPLSKMALEKPKCSSEGFADYVFDFFQRLVNDTRLFATMIEATREYNMIGETFLFIEQPEGFSDLKLCKSAIDFLKKGRGYAASITPMSEAENGPIVGQERQITPDFIESKRQKVSSYNLLYKVGASRNARQERKELLDSLLEEGITVDPDEDVADVVRDIVKKKNRLAKLIKAQRVASFKNIPIRKKADDPPAPTGAPAADAPPPADVPGGAPVDPNAPPVDGVADPGADAGLGGDAPSFGGGGGFGGGPSIGGDDIQGAREAVTLADMSKRDQDINELKQVIHLLERKKDLLEELQDLVEKRKIEKEMFEHVTNPDYEGFERIQSLPPEQITIKPGSKGTIEIFYKPSAEEKQGYIDDPDTPQQVKDALQEDGTLPLNQNPFAGSYVLHFARKKSGYELHGRSVLQCVLRTLIYKEKLRQVQTTLASRNMTPKTIISAPGVSPMEVAELRALADEAKADPDFTIVVNYALDWNEITNQGRLLTLDGEYTQLNSNIAIGLGFSPDILIGEGLYGSNRIQLEILNTTYTQFREAATDLIENNMFKWVAMLKGFFELDKYGRPRWLYPKVTFGRMALKDSSEVLETMFNLYSKGSLPVSVIYEYLNMDSESMRRRLEDDIWTVADSRFNEALQSVYSGIGQPLLEQTDVVSRVAKNMQLTEKPQDQGQLEGSGEGV